MKAGGKKNGVFPDLSCHSDTIMLEKCVNAELIKKNLMTFRKNSENIGWVY